MSKKILAIATAGALMVPVAAQAQGFQVPEVQIFATVTGKWVLDPQRCPDIREDFRDAQRNEGRRDRREDRRDQRVADCPPEAYDFIVDAGQGPKFPVRVAPGRIPRRYRRTTLFINGGTIGPDGLPVVDPPDEYETDMDPTYSSPTIFVQPARPTYQQPTYQQPTYQQPTYQQPTYQQPTYRQPVDPTPIPQPDPPRREYEIRDGVIHWLN